MRPSYRRFRPHTLVGKLLPQKLHDSEAFPHDQMGRTARSFNSGGITFSSFGDTTRHGILPVGDTSSMRTLLSGRYIGKSRLIKRNPECRHEEPRPKRPRRMQFVSDIELHGANLHGQAETARNELSSEGSMEGAASRAARLKPASCLLCRWPCPHPRRRHSHPSAFRCAPCPTKSSGSSW